MDSAWVTTPASAWKDLHTWPARGDLTHDEAFVARARQVATDRGAQLRWVLYAGIFGTGQLLVFLGEPVPGSDFQGADFQGSPASSWPPCGGGILRSRTTCWC